MVGKLKIVAALACFVVLSGSYISPLNSARRASAGSPTGYQESEGYNRTGYEDEALGENRYEIEYLINGLTYRVRVRAINADMSVEVWIVGHRQGARAALHPKTSGRDWSVDWRQSLLASV